MSKGAATEEVLGALHAKVARVMTRVLERYLVTIETEGATAAEAQLADEVANVIVIEPSPAFISAVTKFLKDNEISVATDEINELSALERRLADKQKKRGKVVDLQGLPVAESG